MPGRVTKDPSRYTTRTPSVKRIRCRSSSIFQMLRMLSPTDAIVLGSDQRREQAETRPERVRPGTARYATTVAVPPAASIFSLAEAEKACAWMVSAVEIWPSARIFTRPFLPPMPCALSESGVMVESSVPS